MIWLTEGHHYFHKNIIKYTNRPFNSTHQMNKVMTERWNERVQPEDTVYHLGDLALGNRKKLVSLRERLNGKILIVRGNHDRSTTSLRDSGFIVIPKGYHVIGGIKFRLTHDYGSNPRKRYIYTLHGHSHPVLPIEEYEGVDYRRKSINVGVDYWNYYPLSIEHIKEIIKGEFK